MEQVLAFDKDVNHLPEVAPKEKPQAASEESKEEGIDISEVLKSIAESAASELVVEESNELHG